MSKTKQRDIIHRWEGNPIIEIKDLSFKASDICNAAAVKINSKYYLLVTIESLSGQKSIYLATSKDGYKFEIASTPIMKPMEEGPLAQYEDISVMDPRITFLDNTYYITFVANSHHGFRIGLAKTEDFKSVTRLGYISQVDTKGGTLFPEKFNGRYARLERPSSGGRIWISYSDDLVYWGKSEVVLSPRAGFWDPSRVGDAAPPIKLKDGRWLLIYYGIKETSAGPLFRIGAAYLDPEDPSKVISRTNIPILSPREDYERIGDVPNLVFSCGAILEENKLLLYYGVARSAIAIGTTTIEEIDEDCVESEVEY